MTHSEHTTQQLHDIETRWFLNHRATLIGPEPSGPPVTLIKWRQPQTSNYAIDYLLYGGTLFVTGDLGEAVYCWSSPIDLAFLAQTNHPYFLGKLRGMEGCIEAKEFEHHLAAHWIRQCIDDHEDEELKNEFSDLALHIGSQHEWEHHVHDIYNGSNFDSEVAASLCAAPMNWSLRGLSHWKGLCMAHAQLTTP